MDSETPPALEARPLAHQCRELSFFDMKCLPVTFSRNLQRFSWNPYVGVVLNTDVERVMGCYRRFYVNPEEDRKRKQQLAALSEGSPTSRSRNRRRRKKEKKIPVEVSVHSPFQALEKYGKHPYIFQLQRVFEEEINKLRLQNQPHSIPYVPASFHHYEEVPIFESL